MNRELMRHLALVATRAPSIHNTQPWRLEITDEGLDVRADRRRQLHVVDPLGRQLLMSCGALVHHLTVAARALALDASVSLHPSPSDGDLVARITFGATSDLPSADDIRHAEAILHRATDRSRYLDVPLDDAAFQRLREVVESQGAMLLRTRESDRVLLDVLVDHAERELLEDESYAAELHEWVFDAAVAGERADGMPIDAVDPGQGRAEEIKGRRFLPAPPEPRYAGPRIPEHPELLLVTTTSDQPLDWVRAGMALSALLLQATELGLSAQPIGQVTDVAAERARLRAELGLVGAPQLLLRVGRRAGRPVLRSPRRGVDELLGS